ncbi:hypothetical protein [Aliikangiella maris]|uniref:Tox-GHH domain-containing protein n=2 Tax=Aliikangiella maris TaxID=3162458 RepID=A0ABV3MV74_9GAMM
MKVEDLLDKRIFLEKDKPRYSFELPEVEEDLFKIDSNEDLKLQGIDLDKSTFGEGFGFGVDIDEMLTVKPYENKDLSLEERAALKMEYKAAKQAEMREARLDFETSGLEAINKFNSDVDEYIDEIEADQYYEREAAKAYFNYAFEHAEIIGGLKAKYGIQDQLKHIKNTSFYVEDLDDLIELENTYDRSWEISGQKAFVSDVVNTGMTAVSIIAGGMGVGSIFNLGKMAVSSTFRIGSGLGNFVGTSLSGVRATLSGTLKSIGPGVSPYAALLSNVGQNYYALASAGSLTIGVGSMFIPGMDYMPGVDDVMRLTAKGAKASFKAIDNLSDINFTQFGKFTDDLNVSWKMDEGWSNVNSKGIVDDLAVDSFNLKSLDNVAPIHPGRLAAESLETNTSSLLRALRTAGTPESLATAKLISKGKVNVKMFDSDPLKQGVGGRYYFGTNNIEIYRSAFTNNNQAAGYATHETVHFMQGLTRRNYHRGHEFEAFRAQGAVDKSHFTNSWNNTELTDWIDKVYYDVRKAPSVFTDTGRRFGYSVGGNLNTFEVPRVDSALSKVYDGNVPNTNALEITPNLKTIDSTTFFKADHFRSVETPFKPLGENAKKTLKAKVADRSITKEEWHHLQWDRRLSNRRSRGVARYWSLERKRLQQGQPGTRNWSVEQREAILARKTPKYNGEAMEGHHMYNVVDYPQLADFGHNIYPATPAEHLYRLHGGNFQNETRGFPLNPLFSEEF